MMTDLVLDSVENVCRSEQDSDIIMTEVYLSHNNENEVK